VSVFQRTWTATDACSNRASCSQTITFVDAVPPVLADVPVDASVACNAIPEPATPTATDNCDGPVVLTYAEARTDGNCADCYTLVRTWTATDACGNSSSQNQVLTVTVPAPFTASGPADQTVFVGFNVLLATAATGPDPLTYVWRFNGDVIPGATTAAFFMENVPLVAAGRYCVEITGRCQSVTNCATLTVIDH
jgi:hypothetical protein